MFDCNKIRISELKDKYWEIFIDKCGPLIENLKMIAIKFSISIFRKCNRKRYNVFKEY